MQFRTQHMTVAMAMAMYEWNTNLLLADCFRTCTVYYLKTKPITQNPAVPLPHQTLSVFNVIKSPTAVNDRKEKKSLGKYVGHSMSQNPIQTSAALLKPDVYLTGQF